MTVPPITAVAPRPGRQAGGMRLSTVVAALVAGGLLFGAACSGAPNVYEPTATCEPRLCLGPDPVDGPPDGAALCPAGDCNYQTSEGCPTTQTCVIHIDAMAATAVPKCVDVGIRKAGEPCDTRNPDPTQPVSADKLCARGLICVGKQGETQICRKLCCGEKGASYGDWRACDAGESCIRQIQPVVEQPPMGSGNFVNIDHPGVFACVPVNECDVLNADSCKDNTDGRTVCRIIDPLGRVACRPKQSASSQLGGPCAHFDQCGPVQHCVQTKDINGAPQTDLTCRRLCRPQICDQSACPVEEGICVHFDRDPEGVRECTPNFDAKTYCYELDASIPLPAKPPPDAGHRDAAQSG